MTLQFICAEIERLHLQIRRQQKEVFTLQRSDVGAASAELLLARMQASVDALCIGSEAVHRLVQTIATFDDFCTANDPHGEHDFGAFEFDGVEVFFKIDYFDKYLNSHSPDPADPALTERVITLMLAEEY